MPTDPRAQAYRDAKAARSTLKAYDVAWRAFVEWCGARPHLPADPELVAEYISARADGGAKASTIGKALAAIGFYHAEKGHNRPGLSETVKATWEGIRRTIGTAPTKKEPITPDALKKAFELLPSNLQGVRDRALLALGFTGAFRRAELVALEVSQLRAVPEGYKVRVFRDKTDKTKKGQWLGIPSGTSPTCPVECLKKWLELARIIKGPVFRAVDRFDRVAPRPPGKEGLAPAAVAQIMKRGASLAGLDPKDFAGHSLRSGLVTAAARKGAPAHVIMKQTGHRSVQTMHGYIRDATLFDQNAAKGLL